MIFRTLFAGLISAIAVPVAHGQTFQTVHASYGLGTNATIFRIEIDGPRPSGPRGDAGAYLARSAPLASLIQRVKPAFVLNHADLPILDKYDAIFFAESKVIRLRLVLRVETPFANEWKARLQSYFNYLDRDKDGYLNAFEADFAFSPRAMEQLLKTGFANPTLGDGERTFAQLDIDGDGRVSPDELIAYYASITKDLVRSQFNPAGPDVVSQRSTDELFKLFDRDNDGKLSRAELQNLEDLIPQLDLNEDECLTSTELVPNLFNNANVRPSPVPRVDATVPGPLNVWAIGRIPESIVEEILHRYDKDKNLRISKTENPFSAATFARLDKNHDGSLSLTEVLGWREVEPDFIIEMTLAVKQSDCRVKLLANSDGKPAPLANMFRSVENGNAFIRVGNQTIEIACFSPANGAGQNRVGLYSSIYQQADPQNRGFIAEKDLIGPRFQFLRIVFDLMDRNMDGRVTRAEFNTYFIMQSSFVDLPTTLIHGSRTPSLFQLLDTNGDNRLSITELRAAWKNLKDLEPSGGDYITRGAIQPHGQLRFGRSSVVFNQVQTFSPVGMATSSGRGPLWFSKMDRNNDGVISRSEFPGRTEDFEKLDTNRDNLIDLEEAQAAEKRLRASTSKK